jgi:adenine-specific DNA-methyltransferase
MPTLEFKGKASVYSHHLSVPFRELIVEPEKSMPAAGKAPSLDDNLIIHGDNLEALKALLPRYAGKVDVIYIDPPYNTGSEGWRYNDNVNSPLMKQWLSKEVDKEDLERHDKWLCMMWPRLELLRSLLSPNGVLFVSIDDNEFGNLINVLTELFGHDPIATIAVVNNMKGRNDKANFARAHEYLVVFGNGEFEAKGFALTDKQLKDFKYQDERGEKYAQRDLRKRGGADTRELRQKMYFPIYFDKLTGAASLDGSVDTHEIALPIKSDGQDGCWRWGKEKVEANLAIIGKAKSKAGGFGANYRIYLNPDAQVGELSDEEDLWDEDSGEPIERLSKSKSFWWGPELSTDSAIKSLKKIMAGSTEAFDYPKPAAMVGRILTTIGKTDAIVLDSFAGSGTTAHAVLAANAGDKVTESLS